MSYEQLTVGDAVRIFLECRDISGARSDPSTIELTMRFPDGTLLTVTPIKDSVGTYHYDLSLEQSGTYSLRGKASGQNQSVGQGGIFVYPNALAL